MNIKKKNFILIIMLTIAGTLLFACGIFAVVSKSVSFNLALKVEPKVFFSMTLAVSTNNGETWSTAHEVFNNKTGENVVNWATVNQNTIVLNQVLAGSNLPEIANGCKLKLTVTNLTDKSVEDAEEYLHLTLNYLPGQVQTFTMDNGYGIVNMEYGTSTATQEMIITASNILADTYIFIPFLAEIDEKRFTATITTDELCNLVYAQPTFTLGEKFTARFEVPTIVKPYINYVVNVYETTTKEYRYTNHDGKLTLDPSILLGNITIDVETLTEWNGEVLGLNPYATYAGGIGSEGSPYLLSTALELAQLSANTNNGMDYKDTYFRMTNDIYLNDESFNYLDNGYAEVYTMENDVKTVHAYLGTGNNGTECGVLYTDQTNMIISDYKINFWTPIGNSAHNFNGCFMGRFCEIKNMCCISVGSWYVALFGKIGIDSNIIGLGVSNGIVVGPCYMGGVVGFCFGNLISCYNSCDIVVNTSGIAYASFGGVCGVGVKVIQCANLGDINTTSTINTNAIMAGGVVGSFSSLGDKMIGNCFNLGKVNTVTGSWVGGIQGAMGNGEGSTFGLIQNCYNIGELTGTYSQKGGIVGYNWNKYNSICYSYCLTDKTVGIHTSQGEGVVGNATLTEEEMRTQSSFVGWDFENVWAIDENINNGYPYLQCFEHLFTE